MEIIPVIDLLDGRVVRGVGGCREDYQPVRSCLCPSADPSVVLRAFHESLHLQSCYVADLDALQGRGLNRCVLAELSRFPVRLMVDRGPRGIDEVGELFDLGAHAAIVALESLPGTDFALELIQSFGPEKLVLSLDLKNGSLMTELPEFQQQTPLELAIQLLELGYTRMIVLDLAAVGMATGPASLELCQAIHVHAPAIELISGGGVRTVDDLSVMRDAGLNGALIASALHDGTIGPEDLSRLKQDSV